MAKELSKDEVRHVAELAGLFLDEKEIEKFSSQLTKIFDYIDLLNQMETKEVPETSHPTNLKNVWREDQINLERMLTQEEALSNAPDQYQGYFRIKAIFENK